MHYKYVESELHVCEVRITFMLSQNSMYVESELHVCWDRITCMLGQNYVYVETDLHVVYWAAITCSYMLSKNYMYLHVSWALHMHYMYVESE